MDRMEQIEKVLLELAVQSKETDRQMRITDEQMRLTDRQVKQLNKQLGEINNKWGTFTEGMTGPSVEKILFDRFQIQNVSFRQKARRNGEVIELDAFGYSNGEVQTAVVVEIKSHLKDESITQIDETLDKFLTFFPEHADKKLFALVACVSAPENLKNILRKKGIYLALLNDETFEVYDFPNFTPKNFNPKAT